MRVQMSRGGRHSPLVLWDTRSVGEWTVNRGRAGTTSSTRRAFGSQGWRVLQLYPALQGVQVPFLPGSSPRRLQGVPESHLPGQQSPGVATAWAEVICSWQLRTCASPASP